MQPTYKFSEIKSLIKSLDFSSLPILEELIEEEKDGYLGYELRAFHRFFVVKNKELISNEVRVEYLLSFN